jgi:putative transposase
VGTPLGGIRVDPAVGFVTLRPANSLLRVFDSMPEYRRNRVAGGSYFFTVNLLDRRRGLLVERIEALRAAVRDVRRSAPFHVDAWVVLPEHMHCVWTLPEGDDDFSDRWRRIKGVFARSVGGGGAVSESRRRHGECGIWQRRFWEHTVRDERDYAAHVNYTHFNPVKHGLVARAGDWPFSSFRRCVARGVYPADWAGGGADLADAGERR